MAGSRSGEPQKVFKKVQLVIIIRHVLESLSMQTMVKQAVEQFGLFMCHKHLPDNLDVVGFYMLRIHTDPIPVPSSLEQAKAVLPACFETGTVGSKPLNALERIMTHIYIPMLMIQGIGMPRRFKRLLHFLVLFRSI